MKFFLNNWSSLTLTLFLVSIKGQVSIPTCCHVENLSTFQFNCGRSSRAVSTKVPEEIPFTISERLGLFKQSRWVEKDVKCRGGPERKPILKNMSLEITSPQFEFLVDGYLMLHQDLQSAEYLHVDQYCVNELTESTINIKYCEAKCSTIEPCISLCCPLGTIYQWQDSNFLQPPQCVPQTWFPKLYRNAAKNTSVLTEREIRMLQPRYLLRPTLSWRENCATGSTHAFINEKTLDLVNSLTTYVRFRINSQGMPQYRNLYRKWTQFIDGQYCVAGIQVPEMDNLVADTLVACSEDMINDEVQVSEFYGALALLSSNFALVTFVVYALLFDKQNVHGWTTMSHCVAVFFCFIFLGIAHITKEDDEYRVSVACTIVGTLAHYFFIANFTWLLMLSLDLWLTFKSVSAPLARGGRGVKRFYVYSILAWGLPLIVVSIGWFLETKFRLDEDSEVAVPRYGEQFCYVARHALWEFIYGPTAILVILNLFLFCWTSVTLYKFQQSTKLATCQMNQERQTFLLFFKLFFVCGLLWMTELLSVAFSGAHITWYIQIFDSVNILQPVAIWIIFVFKWEVMNALHERYVWIRPIIFPARFLLKKLRRRGNRHADDIALHSKANDTHVSTLDRLHATTTL